MSETAEVMYLWTPEIFGFKCIRQTGTLEGNIWAYKNFRLRYLGNYYWLCTKKVKKSNSTEIVTNFCKEIRPEDEEFASWLLEKRL